MSAGVGESCIRTLLNFLQDFQIVLNAIFICTAAKKPLPAALIRLFSHLSL